MSFQISIYTHTLRNDGINLCTTPRPNTTLRALPGSYLTWVSQSIYQKNSEGMHACHIQLILPTAQQRNKLRRLHFSSFSLLLNAAYKYLCILFTNISANILLCHNIILHVEFLDQVPEHFYGFGSKLSVSCLPDGLASICPPIVCDKVLNYFNLC